MNGKRNNVTIGMLVFYRSIVISGIATILWLMNTFVSKESFKQWESSNVRLREEVQRNIDGRFDSVQIQLNRIEAKIERIPAQRRADISPRAMEFMGKPFNIYTNLYE
jgi:hypothetical protein